MSAAAETALLGQFIAEARDLLEQAGSSLLQLERGGDGDAMNALFRAVHTLKGTSGLFEIAPLTRVVHAGEDLLATVQAGDQALTAEQADMVLDALDQVGHWVDALAALGSLPDGAGDVADALATRLRGGLLPAAGATAVTAPAPGVVPGWALALALPDVMADPGMPLSAIRYRPDPNCFYRGEDPLALMRQVPGLRLLWADPVEAWPDLDGIDPFHCNLCLRAVAAAPAEEIAALFRYVPDQVEILALPVPTTSDPDAAAVLDILLEGQRRLLTEGGPDAAVAAAQALRGAIRWAGRSDLEAPFAAAADQAGAAGRQALLDFIATWRGGPGPAVPEPVAATLAEPRPGPSAAPAVLRVEQAKIDTLMTLIGELVVAKNALAYLARRAEQGALDPRALAREIKDRHALFNRIAEDMQGAVMAVRMLPVDHVFQRFPRLVRDIARRLGKQVELVVEGGATEADKNVIESLADPLIHMVRNSLDHGLELPPERLAAGKPVHGTIRLQALQENDSIVIRISDDGRGIDPETVRRKAVEKGILDAEAAAALLEHEVVDLVFAPGFSTAATVSDLSGRGVGMDVVRSAIEKAGGRVSLRSRKGEGTVVELTLPLSMAVSRIMTVECDGRLFGVPMAVVMETVRTPRTALHRIRDREAFVLRDSVIPVVRLARLLDLPGEDAAGEEEAILVVRLHGERVGVVVTAFREGMEAIVRPMEGVLAGLAGFAGTTLLGDGRVLLILDLRELIR